MKNLKLILFLIVWLCWSCGTNSDQTSDEHGHSHDSEGGHSHDSEGGHSHDQEVIVLDTLEKKVIPASKNSPKYVQLATGLRVIPDIKEAVESVGILTHEGIFGPLLFAERSRAFFIELKPGMFLSEHPHPKESLVYTVSGKWVLCSEGKRQVMETGSLFHFGDNIPTGWEAPFQEGALLLVVKTKEEGADYEPYMDGLRSMMADLEEQRKNGTAFYYNELSEDHEAIQFARDVNPDFSSVLESINY